MNFRSINLVAFSVVLLSSCYTKRPSLGELDFVVVNRGINRTDTIRVTGYTSDLIELKGNDLSIAHDIDNFLISINKPNTYYETWNYQFEDDSLVSIFINDSIEDFVYRENAILNNIRSYENNQFTRKWDFNYNRLFLPSEAELNVLDQDGKPTYTKKFVIQERNNRSYLKPYFLALPYLKDLIPSDMFYLLMVNKKLDYLLEYQDSRDPEIEHYSMSVRHIYFLDHPSTLMKTELNYYNKKGRFHPYVFRYHYKINASN